MDKSRYLAFGSEARAQLEQIEVIYGRIDIRERVGGEAGLESLGYQLHNLYSAIEDLFEIVAAAFENHLAGSHGYHIELLRRMAISVAGVRPRVISDETLRLLDSLRGFRHVFRHAYGSALDARRLRIVLDDARSVRPSLRTDVEEFLSHLGGT